MKFKHDTETLKFPMRYFINFVKKGDEYVPEYTSNFVYGIKFNFDNAAKYLLSYALEHAYPIRRIEFDTNPGIPNKIYLYKQEYAGIPREEICHVELFERDLSWDELKDVCMIKVNSIMNYLDSCVNLEDGEISIPGK